MPRPVIVVDDEAFVLLDDHSYAVTDAVHADWVGKTSWYVNKRTGAVMTNVPRDKDGIGANLTLRNEVMARHAGITKSHLTYHVDGNKRDCRLQNLMQGTESAVRGLLMRRSIADRNRRGSASQPSPAPWSSAPLVLELVQERPSAHQDQET